MTIRRYAVVVAGLAAVVLSGTAQAAPDNSRPTPSIGSARVFSPAGVKAQGQEGPPNSTFTPVAPVRVLDTRDGTGVGGAGSIGPAGQVLVSLAAFVPDNATAVVLNVTGTEPTANTFVTVFAGDIKRPGVSTLNLAPRQTRANATTVLLGAGRQVMVYNEAGNTQVIADLAGYYTTGGGSLYNPQSPIRSLDTRNGPSVGQGGEAVVDLSGLSPNVTAVTFNLTGVDASTNTFVTAYPDGTARPLASSLNLGPNEVVPNLVTVQLGSSRKVRLYNDRGNINLIADLFGVYDSTTGYKFQPLVPFRFFDSRGDRPLEPGVIFVMGSDPTLNIKAFVGNLTGVDASQPTFLVTWPAPSGTPPFVSNLNLVPGQAAANMFMVGTGAEPDHPELGPSSHFTDSAGTVDFIIDLAGYFA